MFPHAQHILKCTKLAPGEIMEGIKELEIKHCTADVGLGSVVVRIYFILLLILFFLQGV